MNFSMKLREASERNNSLLCIGLDTDLEYVPRKFLMESNPIVYFNRAIIDITRNLVCAYKLNLAFYESLGIPGIDALRRTVKYIPKDIPVIGDAKRSDISNSARHYAKALFEVWNFDAATVNPYMGEDAIQPFLEYRDKTVFVLCLTSNKGAEDFQLPDKLYLKVAHKIKEWNVYNNCGAVVGATHPDQVAEIRKVIEDATMLVPGIGAQKGDLNQVVANGLNASREGLIINVSRGIIYASNGEKFEEDIVKTTVEYRDAINLARAQVRCE